MKHSKHLFFFFSGHSSFGMSLARQSIRRSRVRPGRQRLLVYLKIYRKSENIISPFRSQYLSETAVSVKVFISNTIVFLNDLKVNAEKLTTNRKTQIKSS